MEARATCQQGPDDSGGRQAIPTRPRRRLMVLHTNSHQQTQTLTTSKPTPRKAREDSEPQPCRNVGSQS